MTRKQMYNFMGYPHRLSSCDGKVRYGSEADARAAMRDHQRQIVCDGMDVYWCWAHNCWHKGHTDKRWWNNRQLEESVRFFNSARPRRSGYNTSHHRRRLRSAGQIMKWEGSQ